MNNSHISIKSYNTTISLIRVISMFMIITCHILQGLNIELAVWVNLGVQIFFFVSGFLYGNKEITNIKQWYKKRIVRVLIPSSILVIIMLFIEKIFLFKCYTKIYIFGNLLGFQGSYGTLKTMPHTWFITYILICYLITPLLQKISLDSKNEFQFFVTLFSAIVFIQFLGYFRVINLTIPWIGNYIIGYFFSKYYILNNHKKSNFYKVIITLAITTTPITLILQYRFLDIKLPNVLVANTVLIGQWNHVLLGSSLFLILYYIFNKIHIKQNIILNNLDKYSFYIYLVHQIIIYQNFSILHITKYLWLNIVLIYLASYILGLVYFYIVQFIIFFTYKIFKVIKPIKKGLLQNSAADKKPGQTS